MIQFFELTIILFLWIVSFYMIFIAKDKVSELYTTHKNEVPKVRYTIILR